MPEFTIAARAAPAPAAESPFDEAALLERVEGDVELLAEIVALFREGSPRLLEEVRAAVAAGDSAALKRAAHTLKGAASNFGATAVVGIALELEMMGRANDLSWAAQARDNLEVFMCELDAVLARLLGLAD
jgi:HPt (histidine-containing phosphotransfer) domain-containing protein